MPRVGRAAAANFFRRRVHKLNAAAPVQVQVDEPRRGVQPAAVKAGKGRVLRGRRCMYGQDFAVFNVNRGVRQQVMPPDQGDVGDSCFHGQTSSTSSRSTAAS